jgi:hypothetical protein
VANQSQWLTFAALVVAFIAGYSIVGYVVRKLKTRYGHPPLPDHNHSPLSIDDRFEGDKNNGQ